MFLDFKKWAKSIQIVGYNGASTVHKIHGGGGGPATK